MASCIHQLKNWTEFYWDEKLVLDILGEVKYLQGKLLGKVELLGFDLKDEANLETLIQDVIQTSEIEGELLNPDQVRSSIAIRLGLEHSGMVYSDRHVEGIVQVMLDATQNSMKLLDDERLFSWHAALFPTGRSGMHKLEIGKWRTGEIQVVSGAMGREKIHFEAPKPERLAKEMQGFINWFNNDKFQDPLLKAAVVHFWFVTLHPFDDGNGRIARALSDMQLSRADEVNQRFYSMSSEIKNRRKSYYDILEKSQRGDQDITAWMLWFLSCLKEAIVSSSNIIDKVVFKHLFWVKNLALISNDRQKLMLNKLITDIKGNLTTTKWAKMAKTSQDTALRDISDLVKKGILKKTKDGGRSTQYSLAVN